ncbi:MAG: 3-phosphoshikimate 1-carboxyvinyltransferase [Acutalibacteraceae bacterium]|nr:3-phosphoshikimate 1-carboxyvinyltransferase [Acutalibacteraceae bacterium]
MVVTINKSTAFGRVKAPPSKSMAHRYLICAALSPESEIKGVGFSEDIKATLSCLQALGARAEIIGDTVRIGGIDIEKGIKSNKLFCNESGSTLRFLIPICLLFDDEITLSGSRRLMQRSLSVYADICAAAGLKFSQTEDSVTVKGRLKAGKYSVRGDVSSQFISGLMFALSLLPDDSIIDITGAIESGSYLGMTVKALADFGVRISRTDEHTIYIKGNQTYKPRSLTVEGDYSNAAFFDVLNALGGNVAVSGLKADTCQGDAVYKKLFGEIVRGTPQIDISDCPDLGPVLMAAAAANNGAHFTGTHRLKIKESDRGAAMAEELSKFGCRVQVDDNEITVHKCELKTPELPLDGHNDHRIVMSLAVLSTLTGGQIYGAEAVSKSFPDFFERFSSLGIDLGCQE